MRRILICLSLLLATACSAQFPVDPDVPSWFVPAKERMQTSGMLVGYPEGMVKNFRVTRFYAAVAAHATYKHLEIVTDELEGGGKAEADIEAWWPLIDDLDRMLLEFKKELTAMGVADIPGIRKQLRRIQSRLALRGMDPKRPVPEWVGPALADLKAKGLLIGNPDGLWDRRPATRYECAVATHASFSYLRDIISDAKIGNGSGFDGMSSSMKSLARLFVEFRRELTTMSVYEGGDSEHGIMLELKGYESYLKILGQRSTQFRDVPMGHWAARSIKDLRAIGIFVGYPDGKFRGDR